MNEVQVSDSREVASRKPRLPLFRFNRRFVICCALCAATLQLALAEIPRAKQSEGRISVPTLPALQATVARWDSLLLLARASARSESTSWQIIERQRKKVADNRWERFETEFGIEGKRRTGMLGSVQSAKYTLDELTFAVDDFTENVSDALKFEYDDGHLRRMASLDESPRHSSVGPWGTTPRSVRLGADINLTDGRPYLGLVVVVPFGN